MNEPADRGQKPGECGLSADTTPLESHPDTTRTAKRLIRLGWWTFGGALPVTLLGAHLISAGGKSPSKFAQGVHSTGLLIMLVGLLIALAGYRTPWLVNVVDIRFPLTDVPRRDRDRTD